MSEEPQWQQKGDLPPVGFPPGLKVQRAPLFSWLHVDTGHLLPLPRLIWGHVFFAFGRHRALLIPGTITGHLPQ